MMKMSEVLELVKGNAEAEYTVRERIPEAVLEGSTYLYEIKQDPETLMWHWEAIWRNGESVQDSRGYDSFEAAVASAERYL